LKLSRISHVLTLSAFSLAALAISGCGQDVAACGDVCPAGSSSSCSETCTDLQTSCSNASPNASGDFQALLTCIANAGGTFSSVPALCAPAAATASKDCGQAVTFDAGGGADTGSAGLDGSR
jgi:hypothetical protein